VSTLLSDVDELYRSCVMEPDRWTEQALADWAESVGSGPDVDRDVARHLRRVIGAARRLAAHWQDVERADASDDWRSRVDVALGARAWRPQLDLAMHLLEAAPDADRFDVVASLFPVVMHAPFMDGISYVEWSELGADR
jgi:hypothetical protein